MNKDLEIQDLALEVMDLLGVALYFAGAKKNQIETLIDLYMHELDRMDENLPYNQDQMIKIIQTLQNKYPQHFGQ
ncbi:hypothetical protein [Helicobacter pametensis]|uniref:hypothetical protein n=1 Tax=Helicobacter pametensis TaxID=95149 RepID=UPI000484A89A|nr:hypothetical protein [Helicobacter pametensis]